MGTKQAPVAWVIDTNVFDRIIDGRFLLSDLPNKRQLIVTHVQHDELKQIPETKRDWREQLLNFFERLNVEKVPTESAVWNISRWGEAKWAADNAHRDILTALNRKRKKPNNTKDALIGEVALKHGYGLITADDDFSDVMKQFGVLVINIP